MLPSQLTNIPDPSATHYYNHWRTEYSVDEMRKGKFGRKRTGHWLIVRAAKREILHVISRKWKRKYCFTRSVACRNWRRMRSWSRAATDFHVPAGVIWSLEWQVWAVSGLRQATVCFDCVADGGSTSLAPIFSQAIMYEGFWKSRNILFRFWKKHIKLLFEKITSKVESSFYSTMSEELAPQK